MARKKSTGKSPYKKYGKTPFKFSDLYYQWFDAVVKDNNPSLARVIAERHKAKFLHA